MPPRATPATPPGSNRLAAWLRTREGKIAAGGAAALVVVVLALRKGGGGVAGRASGLMPSAIQPPGDGTMQSQLDQLGGQGGSLAGLVTATQDLTGGVANLRDLLEVQNPLPGTLTRVGGLRAEEGGFAGPGQRVIAWSPVTGAVGYAVRGKGGTEVIEPSPMHRTAQFAPGQYTYYVAPLDASGQRGPEAELSFTV